MNQVEHRVFSPLACSSGAEITEGTSNDGVIRYDSAAVIASTSGPGFLINGAKGQIFQSNLTVLSQSWAVEWDTWQEVYTRFLSCPINDGISDGGVYFYQT